MSHIHILAHLDLPGLVCPPQSPEWNLIDRHCLRLLHLTSKTCLCLFQPPIEEDDHSLEGPSPPLSAGSFVQELFQAQYRYTLISNKNAF